MLTFIVNFCSIGRLKKALAFANCSSRRSLSIPWFFTARGWCAHQLGQHSPVHILQLHCLLRRLRTLQFRRPALTAIPQEGNLAGVQTRVCCCWPAACSPSSPTGSQTKRLDWKEVHIKISAQILVPTFTKIGRTVEETRAETSVPHNSSCFSST